MTRDENVKFTLKGWISISVVTFTVMRQPSCSLEGILDKKKKGIEKREQEGKFFLKKCLGSCFLNMSTKSLFDTPIKIHKVELTRCGNFLTDLPLMRGLLFFNCPFL